MASTVNSGWQPHSRGTAAPISRYGPPGQNKGVRGTEPQPECQTGMLQLFLGTFEKRHLWQLTTA